MFSAVDRKYSPYLCCQKAERSQAKVLGLEPTSSKMCFQNPGLLKCKSLSPRVFKQTSSVSVLPFLFKALMPLLLERDDLPGLIASCSSVYSPVESWVAASCSTFKSTEKAVRPTLFSKVILFVCLFVSFYFFQTTGFLSFCVEAFFFLKSES